MSPRRSIVAGLLLVCGSLAFTGCVRRGGAAADNRRLSVEVAELRAQTRRDRRAIVDLEHRIALAAVASPELEVIQDAPSATPAAPPAALPAEPPAVEPMTASPYYDDDGTEIIYEGDAAVASTKRPRLTLHEQPIYDDDDPADAPLIVPSSGELPVLRGDIPTVDAQLRRARSAPARSRGASAGDPREEYQRYYLALGAGNHAYAVTGFRNFVERYPEHDFADNAQYWLGESFYDQKDYKAAAAEFRRVVDRYPRGNKVADALLKLGFCHAAQGHPDEAKQVLRQVVELYPKTAPARLAGERLAALERTP